MSIWNLSLITADRVNGWSYGAVVAGTILGLIAAILLEGDTAIGAAILAAGFLRALFLMLG